MKKARLIPTKYRIKFEDYERIKMDQTQGEAYHYPPKVTCLGCKKQFFEYDSWTFGGQVPFCRDCMGRTLEYHVWMINRGGPEYMDDPRSFEDVCELEQSAQREVGSNFSSFSNNVGSVDDAECGDDVVGEGHGQDSTSEDK